MTAAVLAGLLAGYGIAVPVGAVGAYLVALTARTSLRVGAAAALGVATVDGAYALAAVLGGAGLVGLLAPVEDVLRRLAAAVLLGVAAWTVLGALRRHRAAGAEAAVSDAESTSPVRAYGTLVAMTLLNPATVVYFVAVVLGNQAGAAGTWPERAAFAAAAFTASASWQLLLACGGALLGRVLTGPRGRLGTALAAGAVVAVLAVRTAWG